MKLAVQEGLVPGRSFAEKLDHAASYGYDGIEIGGRHLGERFDELSRALDGHPVRISTICSGYDGCLLDPDKHERAKAVAGMEELLELGGRLGAVGLIFVPLFGPPRIPDLSPWKTPVELETELLVELLSPLAETARRSGCLLLLEPLNRYETHLLRRLEDAARIAGRVKDRGLAIMGDLFHMSLEEDDIPGALRAHGRRLRHIHLADSQRLQPGTGHTDFRAAFAALREARFNDYMALECGLRGRPAQALTECARFLREQMP